MSYFTNGINAFNRYSIETGLDISKWENSSALV